MHEYTCPECQTVLRSNAPAPAGKKIRCKNCGHAFVPGGGLAFADEEEPKKKKVDDDTDVNPYGVAKEPEEGEEGARKHVVKFGEVEDKFRRSTRGPAMALMVLPTNLLIAQGALTFIAGVVLVIAGLFPWVFSDVELSDDELREVFGNVLIGIVLFFWGCVVCLGASRAQNLESYTWSWVGALTGIPAGIFCMVMLRNPKVIAGFQEMEGALDEDEGKDLVDEDDDDEDDEDEDEDDDE